MSPRRLLGAAACALCAACGGGPTGPGQARIEVAAGADQRGIPGWQLEEQVTVRVLDGSGQPRADVPVRFTADDGGRASPLTSNTDASGVARTGWILSGTLGTQSLTASVDGGAVTATFQATALGPGETDLVVVHGTLAPVTGIAVVREEISRLRLLGSGPASDTLIPIPPADEPGKEVVVFGLGNRPLRAAPSWTPGVDTVHVTMAAPVAVDIDFEVRAGSFQGWMAILEDQLAAMESVWVDEGLGLVLGTVTYVDATSPGVDVPIVSSGLCSGATAEGAIKVELVTSIDEGTYLGWGCWSGHVYLALGTERAPFLLAHELGHTFTLEHTANGMMRPNGPQRDVREGETFRSHFYFWSSLNTIFSAQPPALHRDCLVPALCLPTTLDLRTGSPGMGSPAILAQGGAGTPVDAVPVGPPRR